MRVWLRVAFCFVLPCAAFASSPASAQGLQLRSRARLSVEPLFGGDTLMANGWSAVLIEVENLTGADQRGELHLSVGSFMGTSMRAELPLDVPARQTRQTIVPVFTGRSGSAVEVRFERPDGRVLANDRTSTNAVAAERSVVVFGDPPRLRGALLDLDVEADLHGGTRQVRFPVGTVRFDPATGDPLLPETAGPWSTVKLLVASAPVLARVSATQRAAIEDWLRTGGQLLVFPRSQIDLRHWTLELAGTIGTDGPPLGASVMVPRGGPRFALACSTEQRQEVFGCSRAFGAGRVYVAGYDGTTVAAIESGSPRELVTALLAARVMPPALHYGRGVEEFSGNWRNSGSFGLMRAVLDPNEGFRPALMLVTLVFIFYVVLIGPLNFTFVKKRNRPTLALVTTPLIASSCVLLLVAVGYLGKGVTMRYRRVELIEFVEGQSRAPARRYTSLFSTRPGTFELPTGHPGALVRHIGGGSGQGPAHRTEGDETRLVDFRAGLWETTFLREDRFVDLGGAVTFERDGLLLTAVTNEGDQELSGAILIDTLGALYSIGDIPAGARAEIPRVPETTLPLRFISDPSSGAAQSVAELLGHEDDEDEAERVRALIRLIGDRFVPRVAPVLYARVAASGTSIGGIFGAEVDRRWVRVRPRIEEPAVIPAPAIEPDPYAVERTHPPPELEAASAPEDAAVPPSALLDGGAP